MSGSLRVVDRIVGPVRLRLSIVGLISAAAGMTEALLLLIIARGAAAAVAGSDNDGSAVSIPFGLTVENLLWLGLVLVVLVFLLQLVAASAVAGLYSVSIHRARDRFLTKYSKTPWPAKAEIESSEVVQAATNVANKTAEAVLAAAQSITAGANFTALLVGALLINPLGALALIVGVFALLILVVPLIRIGRRTNARLVKDNLALLRAIQQYSVIGREVEVFGVQRESVSPIVELSSVQADGMRRARFALSAGSIVFKTSALGLIVVILLVARSFDGVSVAEFGGIALILLRSVSYGQAAQTQAQTFIESGPWVGDLDRLFDRLGTEQDSHRFQPTKVLDSRAGVNIRLDGVSFAYPGGTDALTDLNLELPSGQMIGVIGPSGAGKTTLIELLLRLRVPTSGVIWVNDVDLNQIDGASWNDRIAFVPQEPVLIRGTVRDNVRFFRDGISDEMVMNALQLAGVDFDSRAWIDGIDTDVGSLGDNVSGGQKQRVAIARALVGSPQLLVLDEPTSALDIASETTVTESLQKIRAGMTIVVIAHRLTTLRDCDLVVALDGGRIRAVGTPETLEELSAYMLADK